MFRRALLAAVAVASVAVPAAPSHAQYAPCGGDVWDCRDRVCDLLLSGCTSPYVGCYRTPDFVICV